MTKRRDSMIAALFAISLMMAWSHETAQAQNQQPAPPIHQTAGTFVPVTGIPDGDATPSPLAADLQDAFVEGQDLIALHAVTPAMFAEADELVRQRNGDISPGPKRAGIVRASGPTVIDMSAASARVTPDGRVLWTLAVKSPGAVAIRLHFEGLDLGAGSLVMYGKLGSDVISRGPFGGRGPKGDGEFWSPTVPGDTAYVEIADEVDAQLSVTEIAHFDQHPYGDELGGSNGNGVFACHLDAMCESVNSFARAATGQMNFISGGVPLVCTGTQLNDLDNETLMPYFLTAHHCLHFQSEVDTLEVVWLWQRNACGGALPDFDTLPRNLGGDLLVGRAANDMVFMRLSGGVRGGTALAGWTTETSLDNAHGIHHPSGSWKRATHLDSVGACPGCLCRDGTEFDYYNMVSGLVEGGSSGSGVFNSGGQIAGQLLGRCSACCDPDNMNCSNIDDYWAIYGEFEQTYPAIRSWLEIGGTINIDWTNTSSPYAGTPADPYRTIAQGNAIAWDGCRMRIRTGSYNEAITINRQVLMMANGGPVTIGQ